MNKATTPVSIQELQHNLSVYLELAKSKPLAVTQLGKEEIWLVNPVRFRITKRKNRANVKRGNPRQSAFIGYYKNRPDWQGKSHAEIAHDLRKTAWYGQ